MIGRQTTMQTPNSIGPYRILGTLGRGGMGLVYRAQHLRTGAFAALKTVQVPRANQLQSVRREIHAMAQLRHPGVVRILDEGVEDGVPWHAMELVEGVDLRRFCSRLWDPGNAAEAEAPTDLQGSLAGWKLPDRADEERTLIVRPPRAEGLRELLGVIRRVCDALAYVHGEGVVHRDLKPGNVLVRPDGWPVLVDFGLTSRFAGGSGRETLDGGAGGGGTAAYMAPEHHLPGPADPRTDLYSLGCVVYELLTGRPPFVGATGSAVLWQHATAEPVAPSALTADVPAPLDELILQLLRKRPAERPGYADDVSRSLARMGAKDLAPHDLPRPRPYLYRSGLAGRTWALNELRRQLARFLREGRGCCTLLRGESGIGKTRLAMEVARELDTEEIRILTGQCVAVSTDAAESQGQVGGPLHPLRRSLQSIADRCRELGPQEAVDALGHRGPLLARYEPAFARIPGLEVFQEPADLPAVAARLRLFLYLLESYTWFARDTPVLLVLDDLQWADDLTVGLIAYLLRGERLERAKVFVLAICRSDEMGPGLQAAFEGTAAMRMDLGRLEEDAVGAMVRDMLAQAETPAAFVHFLARHSQGNPFFVSEYLVSAVAEGVLRRDEAGRWLVATPGADSAPEADYESLPLPATVRSLVGRRLERLGADALLLVDSAAVLGREVELPMLARVTGLKPERLIDALQELLAAQLVEELDGGSLRFLHDKVREAVNDSIPEVGLRELHRLSARALAFELDELPPQDRLQALVGLGHHSGAGGRSRPRPRVLSAGRAAGSRRVRSWRGGAPVPRVPAACGRPQPRERAGPERAGPRHSSPAGKRARGDHRRAAALAEAHALQDRGAEARTLRSLGNAEWASGRPKRRASTSRRRWRWREKSETPSWKGSLWATLRSCAKSWARRRPPSSFTDRRWSCTAEPGTGDSKASHSATWDVIHHELGRRQPPWSCTGRRWPCTANSATGASRP